MNIESKLKEMGLELPDPLPAVGNYLGAVQTGNLLFVSGHGPRRGKEIIFPGKVGRELTIEQGYESARMVMLNLLSTVKHQLGNLDRIKRIVKLFGMVNCTEDFTAHPKVINGASDLLVELFGDSGKHARSAVGMNSLPMNISVEIEMILEIE